MQLELYICYQHTFRLKTPAKCISRLDLLIPIYRISKYSKNPKCLLKIGQKTILERNFDIWKSLGFKNYFNLVPHCDFIIGNSSSGIIEMPYFKKGTVNLGSRQLGRLTSKSIINSEIKKNSIIKALKKLQSKSFKNKIKKNNYFYGKQGASIKIVNILKKVKLTNLTDKKFYDIN